MLIDSRGFAPQHKWDRNFILTLTVLAWIGVIMGFGGDILHRLAAHKPPYLLIVHIHAAAFVGWMVLFTVQILLIRSSRASLHKRLGLWMMALAVFMVVIGPLAQIQVEASHSGTPDFDPAFLAISFTEMSAFAGLVAAAFILRQQRPAHKRLIILATLYITSAGFARWEGPWLGPILGHGFWGLASIMYFGSNVLILGLGAYDLVTRRRLHPVYLLALVWIAANELTSIWLYYSPAWLAFTTRLVEPLIGG